MALFSISPQFQGNKLPSSSILSPLAAIGSTGRSSGGSGSKSKEDTIKTDKMLYRQSLETKNALSAAERKYKDVQRRVALEAMDSNDPIGVMTKGNLFQDLKTALFEYTSTKDQIEALIPMQQQNKEIYDKSVEQISDGKLNENDPYFNNGSFEYVPAKDKEGNDIVRPLKVSEHLDRMRDIPMGSELRRYSAPDMEALFTAYDDAFQGIKYEDKFTQSGFYDKNGKLPTEVLNANKNDQYNVGNKHSITKISGNKQVVQAAYNDFISTVEADPKLKRAFDYMTAMEEYRSISEGKEFNYAAFQKDFADTRKAKYLQNRFVESYDQLILGKKKTVDKGKWDLPTLIDQELVTPSKDAITISSKGLEDNVYTKEDIPGYRTWSMKTNQYYSYVNQEAHKVAGTSNAIKLDDSFGDFGYQTYGDPLNLNDFKGLGIQVGGLIPVVTEYPSPTVLPKESEKIGVKLTTNDDYVFMDPALGRRIEERDMLIAQRVPDVQMGFGHEKTYYDIKLEDKIRAINLQISDELRVYSKRANVSTETGHTITQEDMDKLEDYYMKHANRYGEKVKTHRFVFNVPKESWEKVDERMNFIDADGKIGYGKWSGATKTITLKDQEWKPWIIDIPVTEGEISSFGNHFQDVSQLAQDIAQKQMNQINAQKELVESTSSENPTE